eukprot:1447350-Pleurochrysis_carterae.AAC.1
MLASEHIGVMQAWPRWACVILLTHSCLRPRIAASALLRAHTAPTAYAHTYTAARPRFTRPPPPPSPLSQVHDLHVWALSGDKLNMWAHLTVAPGAKSTPILYAAQKVAASVECHHSCFQIEDTSTYTKEACGEVCYGPRPVSPHT